MISNKSLAFRSISPENLNRLILDKGDKNEHVLVVSDEKPQQSFTVAYVNDREDSRFAVQDDPNNNDQVLITGYQPDFETEKVWNFGNNIFSDKPLSVKKSSDGNLPYTPIGTLSIMTKDVPSLIGKKFIHPLSGGKTFKYSDLFNIDRYIKPLTILNAEDKKEYQVDDSKLSKLPDFR
jgi:hypothetical protein